MELVYNSQGVSDFLWESCMLCRRGEFPTSCKGPIKAQLVLFGVVFGVCSVPRVTTAETEFVCVCVFAGERGCLCLYALRTLCPTYLGSQ